MAGAGSMGSAACYHLAKRGACVLAFDRFDLPHDRGSHHGHSRMIRQAYFEHPSYVPLLLRAYALWSELEEDIGVAEVPERQLLHLTGGLYMGPPEGAIVSGSRASAEEHHLPFQMLEGRDVAARFPAFRCPTGFEVFYEERAGFVIPERAVAAHAEEAKRHGAEIRVDEEVIEWKADGRGVVVRTPCGEYRAGHLVLTGGAWNGGLLRDLDVELTVTRQVLAWFDAQGDRGRLALGSLPCWFIETDPPYGHYGFPMLASGQRGLKLALHKPGGRIVPEELASEAQQPTDKEIEQLRVVLRTYLPDGDGPLLAARTCLYTNSVDGHFLAGRHPDHEHVSLAAGFSGHGFKFASVMGEILADLALDGGTEHPIDFLSPARFR